MKRVLLAILVGTAAYQYDGPNGTVQWPDKFPSCGGKLQSPVDLMTPDMALNLCSSNPLVLYNYKMMFWKGLLRNTGHTAEVLSNVIWFKPGIKGGPLNGSYELIKYHFHWGPSRRPGSEHTIAGRQRSMEVHLVHFKKSYGSWQEASKHPDGLAVVAFFLEVTPGASDYWFAKFAQRLVDVRREGSSIKVSYWTATRWFQKRVTSSGYYTYQGSLTTPPCTEVVTWIIFSESINISYEQLLKFRQLEAKTGPIRQNYRPVQPKNGRVIRYK